MGRLLHADDVFVLIESCENYPLLRDSEAADNKNTRKRRKKRRKHDEKKRPKIEMSEPIETKGCDLLQERIKNDSLAPHFDSVEKIDQSEAELHAQQLTPDSMNSNDQPDDVFEQSKAISEEILNSKEKLLETRSMDEKYVAYNNQLPKNQSPMKDISQTKALETSKVEPETPELILKNSGENLEPTSEPGISKPGDTVSQSEPKISKTESKNDPTTPGAPHSVDLEPQKSPSGGESKTINPVENLCPEDAPKLPLQKSKQSRRRKTKNGKVKGAKLPKRPKIQRKNKKGVNSKPSVIRENILSESPERTEKISKNVEQCQKSLESVLSEPESSELSIKTELLDDSNSVMTKPQEHECEDLKIEASSPGFSFNFESHFCQFKYLVIVPKSEPIDPSDLVQTSGQRKKSVKKEPGIRASGRQRRVRKTDFLKFPMMTLSKTGKINFSEELRKQTGLIRDSRREEKMKKKRKKELDQFTKEALRILIQDEKERAFEEKLKKARLKAAEKAKKKAKLGKKASPAALEPSTTVKPRPARLRKSPTKTDLGDKLSKREKSKRSEKPGSESTVKSEPDTGKTKRGKKKGKPGRKPSNPSPSPVMPPPEPPAPPAPVLGCVTFRSGDKIIRRSPRKLPEAAVNAVNPKTGLVPYAFAALLGNTQGVIPVGLTEKHFVSYRNGFLLNSENKYSCFLYQTRKNLLRPAMKRATPAWFENLENISGGDSGLDSAEEMAIRTLFQEKKRDRTRLRNEKSQPNSPDKTLEKSPVKKYGNTPEKLKSPTKSQTQGESSSSGDSGRETPTAQELKPFSLKEQFHFLYNNRAIDINGYLYAS